MRTPLMPGKRILIVDDEEDLRDVISDSLRNGRLHGRESRKRKRRRRSATGAKFRRGHQRHPDARHRRIELMKLARGLQPAPAVILITGNTIPSSSEILNSARRPC